MPKTKPYLSVIIPAYNEAKNLHSGVLEQVHNFLNKQKFTWEVLIVDDESQDETVQLINKFIKSHKKFKLLKEPHRGKGGTVIAGVLAAKGQIILFTDMDQATPVKEINKFIPEFEAGYDIVIGSRKGRVGAPVIRKLSAATFALLRSILLGLTFRDTQCGFKAFSRKAVNVIFPIMERNWSRKISQGSAVNAGFDIELLLIAKKKGLKIAEVPVNWRHVGTERVQLISDAIEAVKDMLRLRRNSLRGDYK